MKSSYYVAYCREGSERDLFEELLHRMSLIGGHPTRVEASLKGVVVLKEGLLDPEKICSSLSVPSLIFARQLFHAAPEFVTFQGEDRASPLVEKLAEYAAVLIPDRLYADLFIETTDTNEGKKLSPFCRKFSRPFLSRLKRAGFKRVYTGGHHPRIHLLFFNYERALVGVSYASQASPFPMGIARLKFPKEAPSRSTLKLEEAFMTMLSEEERSLLLCSGINAVDLGAAPGGWTYQLVRRGISVTAIDNGALAPELADSFLVKHLQRDAYKYTPSSPVEWMVCDMVDRPQQVAQLVGRWFQKQLCRSAVVNLKLPMHRRYQTVMDCLDLLQKDAQGGLATHQIRVRQLYHDRDEVTLVLIPKGGKARAKAKTVKARR